jgi:hypothetical protein
MKSLNCPNMRMPAGGKNQFWKHHWPRILQNQVEEATSISLRHMRQDFLLEFRQALPSPSKSNLTIQTFVEKDEIKEEYVLIEGRPESLRFLANIILTFVDSDESCGFFF